MSFQGYVRLVATRVSFDRFTQNCRNRDRRWLSDQRKQDITMTTQPDHETDRGNVETQ